MAQHVCIVLGVDAVVEGLGHLWIVRQEVWDVEVGRQDLFLAVIEVLAPLDVDAHALQGFHGFVVAHARVGVVGVSSHEVEVAVKAGQFIATLVEQGCGNPPHDALAVGHDFVVRGPGQLHFGVPEFSEVPSGSALFRTEGGGDGVQAFQSRHGGFSIQLPRLCQVGFLAKVGHFEQRGAPFHGSCHEVGCLVFDKVQVAEVAVDGAEDRGTDLQHGGHARGSKVEVTMVEEKFGFAAVRGGHRGFGDGERPFGVDAADHLAG